MLNSFRYVWQIRRLSLVLPHDYAQLRHNPWQSNYEKDRNYNDSSSNDDANRSHRFYSKFWRSTPLLGLSWMVTIKDMLGINPIKLDDDPLKDKIKQSWLARKHRRYNDALEVLHQALPEAEERSDPLILTRIIDELSNTYYEMADYENADKCFRDVIQRLVRLHGKSDSSPEFIGVSLKMADIFARKGDLDNAEAGFKHCVSRQLQVMEEHLKKFLISKGAGIEEFHLVEEHGPSYSDPVALFGMCLEMFAHFLVEFRGDDRLVEAQEYMDEVMKISTHLYGSNSFASMNMLNNFGALCVMKNHFEIAKKYLEIGIDRIVNIDECSTLIVGYYCNYAEALFHTGHTEEALTYARRAVSLSKDDNNRIQNYARNFLKQMEKETKSQGKTEGGWFSWLW